MLALGLACFASLPAATLQTPSGITIALSADGQYSVSAASLPWSFAGQLPQPPESITEGSGKDGVGAYQEIQFTYRAGGERSASLRAYLHQKSVLFTVQYVDGEPNTASFPAFTAYPAGLQHLTYWGLFSQHNFGPESGEGPRVHFDDAGNTFILSPADNFLVARTRLDGQTLTTGISPDIADIPAGFTHKSLLVLGAGINHTFDVWGSALTDHHAKHRPHTEADITLQSLGYWTDAGAAYYYASEGNLGYEGTLTEIRNEFRDLDIPLGYLQLDSWFYPKGATATWRNRTGGTYTYSADPANFPHGLAAFQQSLGLPLAVHNRWIDAASPYRAQYSFSGGVSTDPAFWQMLAQSLKESGVSTYEQDWLGDAAHADFNLTDPEAFLTNMASAMAAAGLTMQYCMATPSHFLQGSKYSNLTTIRVSKDRFNRSRWEDFLYASRLASAVGIYPFTDVMLSSETDNLLLATLSTGPVGVGDKIATLNRDNLLKAVRHDGVIVKPDRPLVPLDSSILRDAADATHPLVSAAYTQFNGMRAAYVFAFARGSDTLTRFKPEELGLKGRVYVYNYFTDQGSIVAATDEFSEPMPGDRAYYLVVPINARGLALLGDLDNFVPLGRKRVASVVPGDSVTASVVFAAHENTRTLTGYAAAAPRFFVSAGVLVDQTYDDATHRFRVTLAPGAHAQATLTVIPAGFSGCRQRRVCPGSQPDRQPERPDNR